MRAFPVGFGTRGAAIGNLFVKPAQSTPLADLKTRLIQMCKERDKPYGMLIRKLDFPFSGGNADIQTLRNQLRRIRAARQRPVSPPMLMYRVYPGWARRTGPRHASSGDFRPARCAISWRRRPRRRCSITSTMERPWRATGVGGYIALTSVISPGLLFDELEVDRLQDQLQKPALVPPPDRTATR